MEFILLSIFFAVVLYFLLTSYYKEEQEEQNRLSEQYRENFLKGRRELRTEEQIKKVVGHSDIRTTSYQYGANCDELEKPLSEEL